MKTIANICLFCGASTPRRDAFVLATQSLAQEMVRRDIGLVYGGGAVGLMGVAADAVMALGGRVLGVIPRQLSNRELAHGGLSELVLVDSMHERKAHMYEASDAFIAFPGGFGTLDEIMEILTWKQLGIHDKPIIFANIEGYYDHLSAFFDRAIEDGLIKAEYAPLYHVVDTVSDIFAYLESYAPHTAGVMRWA